jgi:hypothetical protein
MNLYHSNENIYVPSILFIEIQEMQNSGSEAMGQIKAYFTLSTLCRATVCGHNWLYN